MIVPLRPWCLFVVCGLLFGCDQIGPSYRIKLNDVNVLQARETSGDRPYFNTVYLRSTFNTPNSTKLTLRSWEPNDWVSKAQYHAGTLSDGHMHAGDRLAIPWWMGEHEWHNLKLVELGDLLDDPRIEVAGAIVFSIDNNNTPPHVIRGVLNDFTAIMRGVMTSQIERGEWIRSLTNPADFFGQLLTLITNEIRLADLFGNFFQFTVGSTFNPDQPTGVEVILIPTVKGLTAPLTSVFDVTGLAAGPVQIRTTIMPAVSLNRIYTFEGSGARYQVDVMGELADHTEDDWLINELLLSIKTGEDDMRGGGVIDAEITHCQGTLLRTTRFNNVNQAQGQPSYHDQTFSIPYNGTVGSVRGLRLRWSPSQNFPETSDNWDVAVLRLGYPSQLHMGAYFIRNGQPLFRLTDQTRSYNITFGPLHCP